MATIILVDAEEELRANLQDLLEFKGHHVIPYARGEEALENIGTSAPHLILVDYFLPDIDGLEVLAQLKTKIPNVPMALVTASPQPSIVEGTQKHGVEKIITKPYSQVEILEKIEEMLTVTK